MEKVLKAPELPRTRNYKKENLPKSKEQKGNETGVLKLGPAQIDEVNTATEENKPVVDDSQPKTNLQIRFHNGERVQLAVNMTHTIGDIHTYVMSAAPISNGEYQLIAGFPPKPLDDPSKTIQEVGLRNAVIT